MSNDKIPLVCGGHEGLTLSALVSNTISAGHDRHSVTTSRADYNLNQIGPGDFQARSFEWVKECFGETIANDLPERVRRFIEEAGELAQSLGMAREECHFMVDYAYDRSVGEVRQEIGGVQVTFNALCSALSVDVQEAGETELARVHQFTDKIREKQKLKPSFKVTDPLYPDRPVIG